jgi:hypothetical protein
MMDRLSVLFFLLPAVVPSLWSLNRAKVKNVLLGSAVALLLSAAYYREFFNRHFSELTSQASVGEIDSAGVLQELQNPIPSLYYPLALIDSQAGPFIGLAMCAGLLVLFRKKKLLSHDLILLFSAGGALLFFSLIAKKQVYYTIPILFPLAFWLSQHLILRRLAWAGGLFTWLGVGVGMWELGKPWLPEAWAAPRHLLARAPSFQEWPLDEALADIEAQHVLVFSEDDTLFEGFLQLAVREALPKAQARGLVLDPMGSREFIDEFDLFVWMGDSAMSWPSKGVVQAELLADHYDPKALPSIAEQWSQQADSFVLERAFPAGDGMLRVYRRKE